MPPAAGQVLPAVVRGSSGAGCRRYGAEQREVDDDEGEKYFKTVFAPTQIIKFTTEDGVEYLWYARQSYHNNDFWTIAFGTYKGQDQRGSHILDIDLTKNTKNPHRVFATIIDIINRFIELDENNEILYLLFESEGDKRTQLYLKRILPKIEHFVVDHIRTFKINATTNKSEVTLKRIS